MEIWDMFDENRKSLGKTHVRGVPTLADEYHIVVEIFTENPDGRILLTQRDHTKTYPSLWECTRGSITAGESSLEGAIRELQEETGLLANAKDLQLVAEVKKGNHFLDTYVWRSRKEITINELSLQLGEVSNANLVSIEELEKMNDRGVLVPEVWKRYQKIQERAI